MRLTALVISLAACGGTKPAAPPAQQQQPVGSVLPTLLGRPVADAPLAGAARTVYERAAASLAAPSIRLEGDRAAWQQKMSAWVELRSKLLRELVAALQQLPEAERRGLFANVVAGVAMDDFVQDLITMPLPKALATGEHAAEVEKAFRDALEAPARPIAQNARQRFARCGELVDTAAPAVRVWAEHCRTRERALAALEARGAQRGTWSQLPREAAVMKDCAGTGEKIEAEPDALPPELAAKPRFVVLYDGDTLTGNDRKRFLAAVSKRVRGHVRQPLLRANELAAAEALVAQRRMTAKGPVCGQPPRLTQVLGAKYRNVVIAYVSTRCMNFVSEKRDPECSVRVGFKRAGTRNRDGLPATLHAPVGSDPRPADWIAAAKSLSTKQPYADVLGGLLGGPFGGPRVIAIKGHGDDDPWLRVGDTILRDTATKLAACVDAEASFDVELAISPAGKPTNITLAPVTKPAAGARVEACVREALAATAFPCTRDGKPAQVDLRMCVAPKPSAAPSEASGS